ncbi:MAG: protein-L-isoaspartate(D-aspartate) O-methyltransferase [Dehalococcoidia bacterium]|nr:protein-L-isoaspartate(D-aspartate) O-methyltransferase [Dehalococcoidia bacterium]
MKGASIERLERAKTDLLVELEAEVKDPRVLAAFRQVPRELFVPEDTRQFAYENRPLPIGYGQTISQPLMVALMTQALLLTGGEKVLEVGTGSGYQAALLSLLCARVVSVELIAPLACSAAERLRSLGYANVDVHVAGDTLGWPEGAPYDGIIVTAAAPEVPLRLLDQLALGGRLVVPVGSRNLQELVRIVKTPEGAQRHNLGPCRFVPLLGRDAWPEAPAG